MIDNIEFDRILFIDIETVPMAKDYEDLTGEFKQLWALKYRTLRNSNDELEPAFFNNAGIFAEFGKIVCISMGFVNGDEFRIKSFAGDNEEALLTDFADLLGKHYNSNYYILCGHNIKEFDVPYMCRRMLINGVKLPTIMNIAGKKPWEVNHLDTMALWKFGDYKSYTSLKLLAALFGIPTPKDDIEGKDVGRVYWHNNELDRIVTYCQKDVFTTAQILKRFVGEPLMDKDSVNFLT